MAGAGMKIIAIEEHFVTGDVVEKWAGLSPTERDDSIDLFPSDGVIEQRLADLSDDRLAQMDATGVDVQVLSLTSPGVQVLRPDDAVAVARRSNDLVAETVRRRPDRYQAFATLPTPAPEAAARELERSVTQLGCKGALLFGRTGDRNADDPAFLPIYEAAAHLRVPLYFHPQIPVRAVRDAYYSGLPGPLSLQLATGGIGWHYETGLQILRLILAGVFDRFPDLQIITGHWGEVILFYLERIDLMSRAATNLHRPMADYVRQNVLVTPSGIFSQRYLRWAIEVLGSDRVLFSTDYPYQFAAGCGARRFLEEAPIGEEGRAKIAHGNWDRLCRQQLAR